MPARSYRMVVPGSACRAAIWTSRRSTSASSTVVTKVWRSPVWVHPREAHSGVAGEVLTQLLGPGERIRRCALIKQFRSPCLQHERASHCGIRFGMMIPLALRSPYGFPMRSWHSSTALLPPDERRAGQRWWHRRWNARCGGRLAIKTRRSSAARDRSTTWTTWSGGPARTSRSRTDRCGRSAWCAWTGPDLRSC